MTSGFCRSRLRLPCAVLWILVNASTTWGQTSRPTPDGIECMVEPMQTVVVSAPTPAVVATVLVDRGDTVKKQQVIATLESSVERASVATARERAESVADLRAAEAHVALERSLFDRAEELLKKGVVASTEKEKREAARLVAEAELKRAEENQTQAHLDLQQAQALLELRTIRSPLDGVVIRRILHPGEYADPLQIMELAQIDPLRVELFAPVGLLGTIQPGMHGTITFEEPIRGERVAEVVVVDPVVDAASGTFGVRLLLPNPEHTIPAGIKCRARFKSEPKRK